MAHSAGSAAERVLVSTGAITEDQLARAVAERFGLDHLDLQRLPRRPRRGQARHPGGDQALPGGAGRVRRRPHAARRDGRPGQRARGRRHRGDDRLRGPPGGRLADRHRLRARAHRRSQLGRRRRRRAGRAARGDVRDRGAAAAGARSTTSRPQTVNFGAGGEDASVIELVQRVIGEAVDRGASDIHFEPQEEEMRVRYRIDGVLHEAATVPVSIVPAVTSRIKILADLDIAERRVPQDGRVSTAGRRQGDRPPRRHAARAVRREGRHAHPGLVEGADQHGAARHAAAGARALHQGVQPVPRRRARHRPDRLGQVDVALRGAQRAQHDRARTSSRSRTRSSTSSRASPRCRSTRRRASRSPPACAR